ncbi:MAG TPA: cyclodeaminase/cyclohydrolase family protein [Solirubrobacterales bacterium]|nr:cyclodeaminase/cyclohydrolase family protein [Solirubrobacterales bacterium]
MPEEKLSSTLSGLLAELSEDAVSPGAGPSAALVVALAAGMVEEAARGSRGGWDEAGGAVAQAAALRRRGASLARRDAEAHATARAALDAVSPVEREEGEGDVRLGPALERAAELPLRIAEAGADTAALAALAAERGATGVRAEAAGAALLATAAADTAAHLIEINLATSADDERVARAREVVGLARRESERALAASG